MTKAELRPYVRAVTEYVDRRDGAWDHLEQHWSEMTTDATTTLAAYRRGQPMLRTEWKTATEILKVAEHAGARTVLGTVLGIVYMWKSDPRRFLDHRAFVFQTARRFSGLAARNVGERWNARTGRVHRFYRDLSPRVSFTLGTLLLGRIGVYGVTVHEEIEKELDAHRRAAQETHRLLRQDAAGEAA